MTEVAPRFFDPYPNGVSPDSTVFLCCFECTQGWICTPTGFTGSKWTRCDCDRDDCAPAGYTSETLCDECDAVLIPETVRGVDHAYPLCGMCCAELSAPKLHPLFSRLFESLFDRLTGIGKKHV